MKKDHERGTRARARGLSLAAVLALGTAATHSPPAAAAELAEPISGQKFTTPLVLGGTNYLLLGVGLRSRQTGKEPKVPLYAMGLYVDHAGAKIPFPALYGKAPTRAMMMAESRAQNFVLWGRFAKLGVLRFIAPFAKTDLEAELRSGLAAVLTDKAADDLRRDAEKFLALFTQDFKAGDELRIHTDETGRIEVQQAGVKKPGPHNPKLARHIWEMWLGSHGLSKEMRQTLVDKLDALKK
ncbi:MAG TPA: chalcone isomerase family protein [Pseudomonadota bacterium]|nr:chalcone isomerase family protein [Pseudomonadota bacterium]